MIIGQIILDLLKQLRMGHPETDEARGKELKAVRKRVSRHA
jgi:hypothetical protein